MVTEMTATVIEAERHGRLVAAGVTLVNLRDLYPDDRTWHAFVFQNFPFGLKRAEQLIGIVALCGGLLRCVTCGQATVCVCACGSLYRPDHPRAVLGPGSPALERAKAAIRANPKKHNRAIAREIGLSEPTVRRARAAIEAIEEP